MQFALKLGVLMAVAAGSAAAQKVVVATKGARQPPQILYGAISFSGDTLTVQATSNSSPFGSVAPVASPGAGMNATPETFNATRASIVIVVGVDDPSRPLNEFTSPGTSVPGEQRDTLIKGYEAQKAQAERKKLQDQIAQDKASQQVPQDLVKCRASRGFDRLTETDDNGGQNVIFGSLQSIQGDVVRFKQTNSATPMEHRMRDLIMIEIGVCQ